MRLDHIAYRVKDRHATAKFFMEVFGYKLAVGEELVDGGFKIKFSDDSTAECLVLVSPEKTSAQQDGMICKSFVEISKIPTEYHMAPEIFVSDGSPDSIVGQWVSNRDDVGGIHHIAYQVDDVKSTMNQMKESGYCEFSSEEPLTCPGLTQIFTKPSELTGVIYEFITREKQGFCKDNVKDLMMSTKDNN